MTQTIPPLVDEPIERVRTALAMHDAGYKWQPLPEDVAALLKAYDKLVGPPEFEPFELKGSNRRLKKVE